MFITDANIDTFVNSSTAGHCANSARSVPAQLPCRWAPFASFFVDSRTRSADPHFARQENSTKIQKHEWSHIWAKSGNLGKFYGAIVVAKGRIGSVCKTF